MASTVAYDDRGTQRILKDVHERLVSFIAAHSALSKATLGLADAIVEFYSPEDDGFAPAVAFQTMAAEGVSGLLCAQVQALVQTALRPLARCTAELGEVDAMVNVCKEADRRSQHYAKKVNELNTKLGIEKREDRRALLKEKAARNNAKLAEAHRERKEVTEKVYRLVESSIRSRYASFNPVFASICQFQEASCSHSHLLSAMLLRVVRSSLGSASLPMAALDAPSPTPAIQPSSRFTTTGPARIPSESKPQSPLPATVQEEVEADLAPSLGSNDADEGAVDGIAESKGPLEPLVDNGNNGLWVGADDYRCSAGIGAVPPQRPSPPAAAAAASAEGRHSGYQDRPDEAVGSRDGGRDVSPVGRPALALSNAEIPVEAETTAKNPSPLQKVAPPVSPPGAEPMPPIRLPKIPVDSETSSAAEPQEQGEPKVGVMAPGRRPSKLGSLPQGVLRPVGVIRGAFLEGHLPWGKRRRMSGMLVKKGAGGGRAAASTRQLFCVAEGPELIMYNSENSLIACGEPRARFRVKGARSVPTGRGAMELEVTIAEEPEPFARAAPPPLGSFDMGMGTMGMQPSARSTRVITLVAPQKHEHARWALALDEAKSWKEEVEKEALLDELEFSLPFRENAFRHLRQTFPDARIEDILGVTAAKKDPALVLKRSTFDATLAATMAASSSSENSIGSGRSSHSKNSSGAGPVGQSSLGGAFNGFGATAGAAASSGGGSIRRVSAGPANSFRSLLNRFEPTRYQQEHVACSTTIVHSSIGVASGADGSGGGGGAGGEKASRWTVGGRMRKRGLGGTKSPTAFGGGVGVSLGASRHGSDSGALSPPPGAGGRAIACVELNSPLRRQTLADGNKMLSTSWARGERSANGGGGGQLYQQGGGGAAAAAVDGESAGSGHALSRMRSLSNSSSTLASSSGMVDMFTQFDSAASPRTVMPSLSTRAAAPGRPDARQPSRERMLILQLFQDSDAVTSSTAVGQPGTSLGTAVADPAVTALAASVAEVPVALESTQSLSAPHSPADEPPLPGARNHPWSARAVNFVPDLGNGEAAVVVRSWNVTLGGGGAGVREAGGGVGWWAGAGDGEPLQRRGGFNPYVTAKHGKVSPVGTTPSGIAGNGGGIDNATLALHSTVKRWGVWGDKDAMPALPPKKKGPWTAGPAAPLASGGHNSNDVDANMTAAAASAADANIQTQNSSSDEDAGATHSTSTSSRDDGDGVGAGVGDGDGERENRESADGGGAEDVEPLVGEDQPAAEVDVPSATVTEGDELFHTAEWTHSYSHRTGGDND